MKKIFLFVCIFAISACSAPATPAPTQIVEPPTPTISAPTPTLQPAALWIAPTVPATLRQAAEGLGISLAPDSQSATQILDVADSGSTWVYALVAPFPTVTDDVTFADLLSTWKGAPSGPLSGHSLQMAESTLRALTAIWGEPASSAVRSVPSEQLLTDSWADMNQWAIIPFEEIQPKWKVIGVDEQSPIHKAFDLDAYKLKVNFGVSGGEELSLPKANYDPSKLTTVILTGVTALVRATATTMEMKGVTYPGELIRATLREADITHVSNEVSFDPTCPYPNPNYRNFILCSAPKYMDLLLDVGTDIVELTGDHFADRGTQAMLDTLELYKQNNLPYYGGGANETEARQPILMEVNGTKLAFMGCNGKRPEKYPKASATTPGAANCDYPFFEKQIQAIKAQGYLVIFTFQHEECYSYGPCWRHEEGFRAVADAGATVVSGSQAHFPHIMEFRGDAFIHYGLGNLFFDQMDYILPDGKVITDTRREFMDRHVFYDGKYLGVELLTSMLEDYARPRPMTQAERAAFLSDYFFHSGFIPQPPIITPQPTLTLTPIAEP
ncbi:MAG: CapA family protein [Anaerolineales bacterium]|nr:CapA family protein [Anaerolineales bacterium]